MSDSISAPHESTTYVDKISTSFVSTLACLLACLFLILILMLIFIVAVVVIIVHSEAIGRYADKSTRSVGGDRRCDQH